jgi:hypothetical protein
MGCWRRARQPLSASGDMAWVRQAFLDYSHLVRATVEAARLPVPILAIGTPVAAVPHGV